MTRKEMTEIFSVLMLAYPRAEMFNGGIEKRGPTITLWARCMEDIDFWTGQQAVFRVCKECAFPPTIAEFRAAAVAVTEDVEEKAKNIFYVIRQKELLSGSLEAMYAGLSEGDEIKSIIDEMGGINNLVRNLKSGGQMWNIDAILTTAKRVIRQGKALPGKSALIPERTTS